MIMKKTIKAAAAVLTAGAMTCALVMPAAAADESADIMTKVAATFAPDDVASTLAGIASVFGPQFQMDLGISMDQDGEAFNGNASLAIDPEAPAQSLTGALDLGDTVLDFQEYLDTSHIVVSVPLLFEQPISFDFTSPNAESFLANMGIDLGSVMEQVQSASSVSNVTVDETFMNAVSEAAAGIAPAEAEPKDCAVGDGTVPCTGMKVEFTGEQLGGIVDTFLNTPLSEGGQTYLQLLEQYASQMTSAGQNVDVSQVADFPETLKQYENYTFAVYCDDSVMRELDITADSYEFALGFEGESIPWHNTVLRADGEEAVSFTGETDGTLTTYRLIADGEELLSSTYNTADGAFTITSEGDTFSGNLTVGDGQVDFSTEFYGLAVSLSMSSSATVVPVEGEALELTTASEEELNQIMTIIDSLTTSISGAAA